MKDSLHNIAAGLHDRWLDGELDADGRRWLARHRAACPACDASFARMERLVGSLDELERPEPRAGFADRVLSQVRPAPVPVWARWQLDSIWSRAAVIALLLGAGLALAGLPLLAGPVLAGLGGPAVLFRGPDLLADGLVTTLRWVEPFRALVGALAALGEALVSSAATPQVLLPLFGIALLSATAFYQLSHILAAPQRRRSSHA